MAARFTIIKLFCLVLLRSIGECTLNSTQLKAILQMYQTKSLELVPKGKNETFTVKLGLEIMNMVPLTFLNDHLYVELRLAETWSDSRLQRTEEYPEDDLILQGDAVSAIWRPDIWILNEKGIKHDTFPVLQESLMISPQGDVIYQISIRATFFCPMSLRRFPFDKQECPMAFESYAYNTSSLRLGLINSTKDSSVTISDTFKVSKFVLDGYKVRIKTNDYGLSGEFDLVEVIFHLKRDIRYYIMQYYFPIICAVLLCCISFWIDHCATPARVALPVTTFLTLTSMVQHVRSSTEVYGKADSLEIFLNISIIFVIAVMVEYIFVGVTSKRPREESQQGEVPGSSATKHSSLLTKFSTRKSRYVLKRKNTYAAPQVHLFDKISRYVFPLSYIIFLTIYFIFFNLYSS